MPQLEEVIERIHAEHPRFVFLTQTSATLYGWVIKEAWKTAWPEEKVPVFLTIDVSGKKGLWDVLLSSNGNYSRVQYLQIPKKERWTHIEKILEKRRDFKQKVKEVNTKLENYNYHPLRDKIVVFDEADTPEGRNPYNPNGGIGRTRTASLAHYVITAAGKSLMSPTFSRFPAIMIYGADDWSRGSIHGFALSYRPWIRCVSYRGRRTYRHPQTDFERREAQEVIKNAKNFGRNIGQHILESMPQTVKKYYAQSYIK